MERRMVQKEGLVMRAMPVVDCVSRAVMAAEKTLWIQKVRSAVQPAKRWKASK